MKPRSVILILLIVLLPLGLLTWATVRLASGERAAVQQQFRELMEDRLRDINGNIQRTLSELQRNMQQVTELDDLDIARLRQLNRNQPQVLQFFVLSEQGQLLYPDPTQALNSAEESFLLRAGRMFSGQDLRDAVLQQEDAQEAPATAAPSPPSASSASSADAGQSALAELQHVLPQQPLLQQQAVAEFAVSSGWLVWYWDRGLNLIYWQRRPSGRIVGAALERARWMADLIAELPDTSLFVKTRDSADGTDSEVFETRIRLLDASGETVYQWGRLELPDIADPFCEIPVTAPLSSWRLQCYVPEERLAVSGRSVYAGLAGGLVAVAAALTAMAWVLYRDYARDMHEAAQQVSFVNQVSHELKTPLTNIRLYAELLEADLEQISGEDAARPRERLNVILSEGQRLSRLIGNVLTFARQKRRTLQPQPRPVIPDQMIAPILDRFRPALQELQIQVETDLQAADTLLLDPDFLEQILGNLISNVEKYAAQGGWLGVRSRLDSERLTVEVSDRGPGIPPVRRGEVFEPFSRLSRSVRCAAGTGIGLSIARQLARLHGGDVVLVDSDRGACFRVTVTARLAESVGV